MAQRVWLIEYRPIVETQQENWPWRIALDETPRRIKPTTTVKRLNRLGENDWMYRAVPYVRVEEESGG